jgi:cytochrome P450
MSEQLGSLPPGPHTPAVVNSVRIAHEPIKAVQKWQARYGDIFTVKLVGFGTGVYVADPIAVRSLFTGDQSDLQAGKANSVLAPMLGVHSMLTLDGPEHLRQRRLLSPRFNGSHIGKYRAIMRNLTMQEIASWQTGSQIALRERMRELTFDIICHVVFGVTEPVRIERLRKTVLALRGSSTLFFLLGIARADLGPLSLGARFAQRLRAADELLYEEIGRRRSEPDVEGRSDVLSLLVGARAEGDQGFTDTELRDILFTLLGAGHATTANSIAFAIDLLLHNPGVLARLQDALAAEGNDDQYLDAVIKESLRLRPVVDGAQRVLERPRTVAGWLLPAGAKVVAGVAGIHLREDLYPQASRFRPERFLQEGAESYTWLPFGGGIRRCLGAAFAQAEMAEVLRAVVMSVELRPLRDRPDRVVRGIILVPKHGVRVSVRRRVPVDTTGTAAFGRS